MRAFWFLVLVVLVAVVVAFALQNNESVSLRFFDWSYSTTMALLIAAVYVLGMISGWTVLGMLRRSVHSVTQSRG